MSAKVSTLLQLCHAPGTWVFLLVAWNDYVNPLKDEISRQSDAFGLDLGPDAWFLEAYPQRMYEIAEQVLAKPWPQDTQELLEGSDDPVILILNRAWDDFDPAQRRHAIVWLTQFIDDPATIRPLLAMLALLVKRDEDVIGYVQDVAARETRQSTRRRFRRAAGKVAKVGSYVEVKPQIFGVGIDMRALLRDIGDATAKA